MVAPWPRSAAEVVPSPVDDEALGLVLVDGADELLAAVVGECTPAKPVPSKRKSA